MKRLLGTIILLLILGNTINAVTDGISFNENWRFFKGEIKGAEAISFDDDSWRKLNLPHDWAIEGPFDSKYNARCGGRHFMVLAGTERPSLGMHNGRTKL